MSVRTWLERHAQTLIGSLGSIAQQPVAAMMTMAVIAIALALPLLLTVFLQNTGTATANWNQAFDITVYLEKKAGTGRAEALARQLRSRRDVTAVRVITADQALAQFRNASGFGDALDALSDNPLPDTLVVTPTLEAGTPAGVTVLKAAIAAAADVQTVQVDTEWVGRLHGILNIVRRVVWLIGLFLGIGMVLVIGNTIRLDILNRRAEIEVMKLVGATDGFARRPFLYSGVWYGLGGGAGAILLVEGAILSLLHPVERLGGLYGSQLHLRGLGWGSTVLLLASSALLGWLGSWLAATRYIRSIEPS